MRKEYIKLHRCVGTIDRKISYVLIERSAAESCLSQKAFSNKSHSAYSFTALATDLAFQPTITVAALLTSVDVLELPQGLTAMIGLPYF